MSESNVPYKPKFPHAHSLLLNVYSNVLKSRGDETVAWCERFKGLCKGWETLKDDGALPPLFTQNFWEDVRDVMGRAQEGIVLSELTEQQKMMTFAAANLQMSFGSR